MGTSIVLFYGGGGVMPKGKPRSKASLIDRSTPILLTQTLWLPTNAEKTPSGDINLPKLDCIHGACKKDIYILKETCFRALPKYQRCTSKRWQTASKR